MSDDALYIHVTDQHGKRHTLEALEGFRVMEAVSYTHLTLPTILRV